MGLDHKQKAALPDTGPDLFAAIKPVLLSGANARDFLTVDKIGHALEATRSSYMEDMQTVHAELEDILFNPHQPVFNDRLTELFVGWDMSGEGPSIFSVLKSAFPRFGIDPESDSAHVASAAAVLGAVPNDCEFHNNAHYRKVTVQVIRLISQHNAMFGGTEDELPPERAALLMAVAAIHDLGHDGRNNIRGGHHYPGLLEDKAFNLSLPYFRGLGLDDESLADIEVMLLCTEVTPFGSPSAPSNMVKAAYAWHFEGGEKPELEGKFRRLLESRSLTQMAMLLHEADIATSAAMTYGMSQNENALFTRELEAARLAEKKAETGYEPLRSGPQQIVSFLNVICGCKMTSRAACALFGDEISVISASAQADADAGIEAFSDPDDAHVVPAPAAKSASYRP